MQSQVRFNRIPEKVPGGFGAQPGQVQQDSGEGSGRLWCTARSSSTGFRRRFQKRFQRRSGRPWCRARSGSTGSGEGSGEGSRKPWCKDLQSQVTCNGFRRRFRRRSGRLWWKVPEKGGFVQSQVRFNRVPEKVPEKVWEALVQSQVRVNRVPKVPEKVPGTFDAEPGQVQQGSEEGSGACLGGFGAEPGQVQQGSGEGSGEGSRKPWRKVDVQSQVRFNGFRRRFRRREALCRARSCSTQFRKRFRRRFQEALVQRCAKPSQVRRKFQKRFHGREGRGGFGAEPGPVQRGSGEGVGGFGADGLGSTGFGREALVQSQVRFNRVPEKVPDKVWEAIWCKARSGSTCSTGSREGCREGPGEGFGNLEARSGLTGSTGFPAFGFAARFRKICKYKTLRLLGISPKFILIHMGRGRKRETRETRERQERDKRETRERQERDKRDTRETQERHKRETRER